MGISVPIFLKSEVELRLNLINVRHWTKAVPEQAFTNCPGIGCFYSGNLVALSCWLYGWQAGVWPHLACGWRGILSLLIRLISPFGWKNHDDNLALPFPHDLHRNECLFVCCHSVMMRSWSSSCQNGWSDSIVHFELCCLISVDSE